MPSYPVCGLAFAAGLYLAWGWLGLLQGIAGRMWPARPDVKSASRPGRGAALVLGLLFSGATYGWALRIDGLDPSSAFGAFIAALGITVGALIGGGFVTAILATWALALLSIAQRADGPLSEHRSRCIALRHFGTGLIPSGLTLGFIAAGLVMVRYAAAYTP